MLRMIRSLLMGLALLLPGAGLADEEPAEATAEASTEASEEAKPPKTPTVAEQLHQLRGERTEILEELTALEEGYSELVDADARSLEIRVQGLMDRLGAVDQRIAVLTSKR